MQKTRNAFFILKETHQENYSKKFERKNTASFTTREGTFSIKTSLPHLPVKAEDRQGTRLRS